MSPLGRRANLRLCRVVHALVVLSLLALAPGSAPTRPAEAQGSGNIAYAYDQLGRLIAVTDLNASSNHTAIYSYDAVGNVTGITKQSKTVLSLFEFAPHQGTVGTTVTIYGTAFSTTPGSNEVKFNGTAATVLTATETQLTVTVPNLATTGTITVKVGSTTVTSGASFTVRVAAPKLSCFGAGTSSCSLSNNLGVAGGSFLVTAATGTTFDTTVLTPTATVTPTIAPIYPNNTITLNNLHAVVTSATSSQLQVEVPPGATTGRISVTNADGTYTTQPGDFSTGNPYFYIAPAGVTASTIQAFAWTAANPAHTGTIALNVPDGQTKRGLLAFDGVAGDTTTIYWSSSSMFASPSCGVLDYAIYDVKGTSMSWPSTNNGLGCSWGTAGHFGPVTLPATGTYTFMLTVNTFFADNNGSMDFSLSVPPSTTQTLAVDGTAVPVTFSGGAQTTALAFFGLTGQRLVLQASDWIPSGATCGAEVTVQARGGAWLVAPHTQSICSTGTNTVPLPPLPATGAYDVVVWPYSSNVTSLKFRLVQNGSPTPTNTPGGTATPTATRTPAPTNTPNLTATVTNTPTLAPTATALTGPAVAVRPASIAPGGVVSVDWGGILPTLTPTTNDWIGLYTTSQPDSPAATVTVTTNGGITGQVALPIPTGIATGDYQVRLFNGSGTGSKLATSNNFAITFATPAVPPTSGPSPTATRTATAGATPTPTRTATATSTATSGPSPTPSASLAARPARIPAGGVISAQWAGIQSPTGADWIGVYVPASADSANLITPVLTTGLASGQVSVAIPTTLSPGAYELRLFNNSGTGSRLAVSNLFTVTNPGTGLVPPGDTAAGGDLARIGAPPTAPVALIVEPIIRLLGRRPTGPAPLPLGEEPSAADEEPSWYWTPYYASGMLSTRYRPAPSPSTPALEAPPGTTALAGHVLTIQGAPLADVTLQVGDQQTRTDATGRFLLTGLPAGHQELVIDGRSASTAARSYGVFVAGVGVAAGVTTALPYTIWMQRLDTRHTVSFPSPTTEEVVLTTPYVPGLEIHIPPGSVIRDREGNALTELGITVIPQAQPPFPLPARKWMPVYFTVQPAGASIQPYGAHVVYPNAMQAAPGTRIDYGYYDPAGEGWFIYGRGTVSADGQQIVPDPETTLWSFTGSATPVECGLNCDAPPPEAPVASTGGSQVSDPVDVATGLHVLKSTDLTLPDIIPARLTRTGRPGDSYSRAFGYGTTNAYDLYLWDAGGGNFNLILPDGGRVLYQLIYSGGTDESRIFRHSTTPSRWYMSQISWNAADQQWHLRLRDGTVYLFGDDTPLQGIRDRNGNQLTLYRNVGRAGTPDAGTIERVVTPSGRWLKFTYDGSNRVTQAQDSLGRVVRYGYGAGTHCEGYLQQVTDPDGLTRTYTYPASGTCRLASMTDGKTNTVLANTYDPTSGKVTQQTFADASTQTITYNPTPTPSPAATVVAVSGPGLQYHKLTLNASGYTTSETFGTGSEAQTYTYQRDPTSHLVTSTTDALGRQTDYAYDALGNVTRITRHTSTTTSGVPGALVTRIDYDPAYSQPVRLTDPRGHVTQFRYDERGNLTTVIDPLGQPTVLTYDPLGQLVTISDAVGQTTRLGYRYGHLVQATDPLGRTARRYVDGAGRLVTSTNALGQTSQRTADVLNRVTAVKDALGQSTTFEYDANGNLTKLTDALSHATNYGYDSRNRVTSRTDPKSNSDTYTYCNPGDADGCTIVGQLKKVTDRRGNVTLYNYDSLYRRTCVAYAVTAGTDPCAPTTYESKVAYTWDKGDRLTELADSLVTTSTTPCGGGAATTKITRCYDDLNRLLTEVTPQGTVSYGYHPNGGPRASMTAGSQSTVSYSYDPADRLQQISQGTSTVGFAYDSLNRRATLTLPNGIVVSYGYDLAGQVTGLTYTLGGSTLGTLSYGYDSAGQRTGTTGTYARTSLPAATTSAPTYDAANRLTTWNGTTITHDNAGNLTNDGTKTYTWDARGRLTAISGGTTFAYAAGRRTNRTFAPAGTPTPTAYLYDGANPVQEQGASGNADLLTGGLDEYFQRTDSAGARSILSDTLGSTVALADSIGTVQTTYTYEPFGATTPGGSQPTNSNPFQFTGRENDGTTTGLYYYRARYYHPTWQRFLSEDPASGDIRFPQSLHPYSYTQNDPIIYTDPTGRVCGFGSIGVLSGAGRAGIGAVGTITPMGLGLCLGHDRDNGGLLGFTLSGGILGSFGACAGPIVGPNITLPPSAATSPPLQACLAQGAGFSAGPNINISSANDWCDLSGPGTTFGAAGGHGLTGAGVEVNVSDSGTGVFGQPPVTITLPHWPGWTEGGIVYGLRTQTSAADSGSRCGASADINYADR
jgi:RHS repeat-associated protein